MPLEDYYQQYIIQIMQEQPDGFGGVLQEWTDGPELQGLYVQSSSGKQRRAEGEGEASSGGSFLWGTAQELSDGDILRRERDGAYFCITGKPVEAHDCSFSKMRKVKAERVEKPK